MATAPPREAPDTTGPRFTFRGTEATAEFKATEEEEEEEDRTIAKGGS